MDIQNKLTEMKILDLKAKAIQELLELDLDLT